MIVKSRRGENVELRGFGPDPNYLPRYGTSSAWAAGIRLDPKVVGGIPAARAAIRIASEAVAKLPLGVYRGERFERDKVRTTWQARLFGGVPNPIDQSWFTLIEQTEAALTGRNNAYWLKVFDTPSDRISLVYFLHPDWVETRWNEDEGMPEYRCILPWNRRPSGWLTSRDVLHFRVGHVSPGDIVAPSPIEIHRHVLGVGVAKSRYEASFYERGVMQSIAVTLPQEVTPEAARRYREALQDEHGGLDNAWRPRVFGGGAEVTTIGLSMRDAQYIESQRFTVEEISRIFGVPSSLLGVSSLYGPDKPISPEHEEDRWLRYGLGPRLERIEQTIRSDPSFFGPGSRDYPMFDTSGVLRGDLATESDISLKKVQSGQWLVDEARARDGLPPLPGGLGQIPQIVPVGGAPNPEPSAPEEE